MENLATLSSVLVFPRTRHGEYLSRKSEMYIHHTRLKASACASRTMATVDWQGQGGLLERGRSELSPLTVTAG